MDSGKRIAREIFNILEAHGVENVVCSPGSRNAPLIMAAEARKKLRKHVIIDERTAAFAALGMAQTSQKPVALVCTSGTALLNYAPAIAEAYYQALPLIVVSADRPREWIDQDDSQTIRQFEALHNFVKKSYDVSDSDCREDYFWYANRILNDAMLLSLRERRGPIHLNVRLSPPLGEVATEDLHETCRIISETDRAAIPTKEEIRKLAAELLGKRVMLVAGFMEPDEKLNRAVNKFRSHSNVAVFAETISNLHLPAEDYMIDSILSAVDQRESAGLMPDIVISVGGALVSRMLKTYIRDCAARNPEIQHWSIGYQHTTVDCFKALTRRIEADPGQLLNMLSAEFAHQKILLGMDCEPSSADRETIADASDSRYYAADWHHLRLRQLTEVREYSASAPWSDLKAFSILLRDVPSSWNLFLSNGTAIRYAQILSERIPHAEFCNRGVSGIEGSTSTALGAEQLYMGGTLLITGDMSFSYDLGALAAASRLDSKLKIVVVNNAGGGIFRFIRATRDLYCREEYLCANPGLDISKIANAFGFGYQLAANESELRHAFLKMLGSQGREILEVRTSPEESTAVLDRFLGLR